MQWYKIFILILRLGSCTFMFAFVCVRLCLWLWRARVLVALYFVRKGVVEKTKEKKAKHILTPMTTVEWTDEAVLGWIWTSFGSSCQTSQVHFTSCVLCDKVLDVKFMVYGHKVCCVPHSSLLTAQTAQILNMFCCSDKIENNIRICESYLRRAYG